jgi:mitogen-activated protein kinase kinase kinase 9
VGFFRAYFLSADYAATMSADPNGAMSCDWPASAAIVPPLTLPVPMPTLYSNGLEPSRARLAAGKVSIVEIVLYNMAAMLAGVAAGYDVRLSNVSPVHPRLHPDR